MYLLNEINSFKENGIVKIKGFLNQSEVNEIIKKIIPFTTSKNDQTSYFASDFKKNLLKLFKLQFTKFLSSNYLIKIAKKKNMKKFADMAFGKESHLNMIDSYYSPISNIEVLPWHVDQAYSGKLEINDNEIIHPDHYSIKFFIYLTKVGSDNGCTSYIPGTNKITYALRKGLKEKKIKYSPHWLLKDLRSFVMKKDNLEYFNTYFNNSDIINKFLKKTSFIETNPENREFDFAMFPGDMIIFDEGGVHKGSKILFNDRRVLRYHFKIKN